MTYDNRYNGALFPTRDPATLAGPFTLDDESRPLRVVCQLSDAGGVHMLAVHAERKDGKGLKKKPVAKGTIRRNTGRGPIARGRLSNGQRSVDIVLWHKRLGDGRTCYQIKPDTVTDHTPDEVPAL